MNGQRLRWSSMMLLAGCVTLATATATAAGAGAGATLFASPAIAESEARQAFEAIRQSVADAAGRPDPNVFCVDLASDRTMCDASLERAGSTYPDTDVDPLSVDQLADGSALVRVEGTLSDGSRYRGFIQVVRDDGVALAVDPVFWVTRVFTEDPSAEPTFAG